MAALPNPGYGQLRQAEVEDLHVSIRPQHHVLRLDVAVDDPRIVCSRQRAAGLNGDLEHLYELETAPLEAQPKRLAINELGRDEVNVAGLPDVVNRENVRDDSAPRRLALPARTGVRVPGR